MKVVTAANTTLDLGITETSPTVGIVDFSKRQTDDFGVTTVVPRGFSHQMSLRFAVPTANLDALQQQIANLRATAATWIADERYDCLSVKGFFKDFSLDVPGNTQSYCSLTIEGLVDTDPFTDPGGDPAPAGQKSTLRLVDPFEITGSKLIASNVPETDYPEWAQGTTYAAGARVIKSATHRVYQSLAAGNMGNDPAGVSGKWLDIAPTNRWAMFDAALGTQTAQASSIVIQLAPGASYDAIALLDVVATSVRVQTASGFDRTVAVAGGKASTVLFLDIPVTSSNVTVTLAGSGAAGGVKAGTFVIGRTVGLGVTEASPTAGITDYSKKDTDDFGAVTVVQRAWAKTMSLRALFRTDAIDTVVGRIATVRARPCLWIGSATLGSLAVYGFFKEFSASVADGFSTLDLSIQGMSAAVKVKPLIATSAWPDITDPKGTKPADNATVGAPPGTSVGGVESSELVDRLKDLEQNGFADTTPPGVPTGLVLTTVLQVDSISGATSALLKADWTANADKDLASYGVAIAQGTGGYIETLVGSDVYQWAVPCNTNFSVKVRAFDTAGNASGYCAAKTLASAKDATPPAAPTDVDAVGMFGGNRVTWINAPDADLAGVEIYANATNTAAGAQLVGLVNALSGRPGGYRHEPLDAGQTRFYFLKSIDTSGNRSGFSASSGAAQTEFIGIPDFTTDMQPLVTVDALPANGNYKGRTVRLRGDLKIYVWTSAAVASGTAYWSRALDGADLGDGSVTNNALAAYSITAGKVAANAITASKVFIGDTSNIVPDPLLVDASAWVGKAFDPDGGNDTWSLVPSANSASSRNILLTPRGPGTVYSIPFQISESTPHYFSARSWSYSGGSYSVFLIYYSDVAGTNEIDRDALVTNRSNGAVTAGTDRAKQFVSPAGTRAARIAVTVNTAQSGAIMTEPIVRRANDGSLIVDGSILAKHIAADQITSREIVSGSLEGDVFKTTTSLPATIVVGTTGASIGTVQKQAAIGAQDPAGRINASTTLIAPGKIQLAGSSTLSDWQHGSDATQIDGGEIYANTITANALVIGLRGITTTGISFTANWNGTAFASNRLAWTAGAIGYLDDGGTATSVGIDAGSVYRSANTTVYVYWAKGATALATTTSQTTAKAANNIVLATYAGGTALVATYGQTIVDGSGITAGTITGVQISALSIGAEHIKANAVQAQHIDVDSLDAISARIGTLRTATTGARLEIKDNQIVGYYANNRMAFQIGVFA